MGFGFLSYSLPLDPDSSRAWRFTWDPIFYEFCQAVRGALRFDLAVYRRLDPASRRLYLLLKKVFWRSEASPAFDLRELCVDVLGFSSSHETWRLKQKLVRCIQTLSAQGIIEVPGDRPTAENLFTKLARGRYTIRFQRGPHFDQPSSSNMTAEPTDSPLYEPLSTIGLDRPAIRRILAVYDPRLIAECADMTLAATERFGVSFFKNSPQAYFMDNIQERAKGKRTPPDWWRSLRAEEERQRRQAARDERPRHDRSEQEFQKYLETEAREAFDRVMARVFQDFKTAGQADEAAKHNARNLTQTHFRNRFFKEHPEWRGDGPRRLAECLPR